MSFRNATRCFLGVCVLALMWSTLASAQDSGTARSALNGEWEIKEYAFRSQANAGLVGGKWVLPEGENKGEWVKANGSKQTFRLDVKTEDVNASIIRFEISISDDDIREGGAGPRKGILRILANGDAEILETPDASQPYPTSFSADSKKNTKYYRLSPAKKTR